MPLRSQLKRRDSGPEGLAWGPGLWGAPPTDAVLLADSSEGGTWREAFGAKRRRPRNETLDDYVHDKAKDFWSSVTHGAPGGCDRRSFSR